MRWAPSRAPARRQSGARRPAPPCRPPAPIVRPGPKAMLSEAVESLNHLAAWHWLALGAVLLALEIASTTNYLLWPGIAALLVGALKFLVPGLDGALSVFLFAILAVASTIAWQRSPYGRKAPANNLNARMDTYLGRKGAAAGDFVAGQGAILLDD